MDARYVFAVRFRVEPAVGGLSLDPEEFETRRTELRADAAMMERGLLVPREQSVALGRVGHQGGAG